MSGSDEYIDCDTIGDCINVNADGSRFYAGVCVNSLTVHRFDCVRVLIEEPDKAGELFSYGQVLAVYDDGFGEGVFVEVRWLLKPQEVIPMKKKKIISLNQELVEGRIIEDIPAGSILEKIQLLSPQLVAEEMAEHRNAEFSARNTFVCRYAVSEASPDLLIPTDSSSLNSRGAELSEFKDLYKKGAVDASFIQSALNSEGCDFDDSVNVGRFAVYSKAVRRLHVSVIPGILPCRTAEKSKIISYLRDGIKRGGHVRPLYISGMPGSGKTACFLAALKTLEDENHRDASSSRKQARDEVVSPTKRLKITDSSNGAAGNGSSSNDVLPEFQFVEINCLKLHSPQDAYSVLWKGLSGERLSSKTALQRLCDYFTIANNKKAFGNSNVVTVCLLDELDFLVSGNESVVYNFFDWPQLPNSSLIVVGIANTMDLPERLTNKARSRMGGDQTNRMIFQPYSFSQVEEILLARLGDLDVFEKVSLGLLARKAVNAAGDLRAALKICQRAIEIHVEEIIRTEKNNEVSTEIQTTISKVPISLVTRAVNEYKENPLMLRTANCCILEKAILVAMCKHAKITDTGNMTLEEIWDRLCYVIDMDCRAIRSAGGGSSFMSTEVTDFLPDVPPYYIFEGAIRRLSDQGVLVVSEPKIHSRLGGGSKQRCMLCECLFSTRMMSSDIVAALDKHRLLNYI